MHAATLLTAAILAVLQLAVAAGAPPACLLGALQKQSNPADVRSLCGTLQSAMEGNLTAACGGASLAPAYAAYSATCASQGVKVAALPTSSGTGGSTQTTSTGTGTGTGTSSSSAASATSSTPSGKNAGVATAPQPVLFAASGLLATFLAGVLFL